MQIAVHVADQDVGFEATEVNAGLTSGSEEMCAYALSRSVFNKAGTECSARAMQ
jgi:hypothetical protein